MQFLTDALPHKGFVRRKLDKACETLRAWHIERAFKNDNVCLN